MRISVPPTILSSMLIQFSPETSDLDFALDGASAPASWTGIDLQLPAGIPPGLLACCISVSTKSTGNLECPSLSEGF